MTVSRLSHDVHFLAFCHHWEQTGTPPLPFADWLREQGEEGAADAVVEAAGVVANGWDTWDTQVYHGNAFGARRPLFRQSKRAVCWLRGNTHLRSGLNPSLFRLLRRGRFGGVDRIYLSFAEAILDYLEAYVANRKGHSHELPRPS